MTGALQRGVAWRTRAWWFRPAPALRPAIVRVLVGAYCIVLLGGRISQDIALAQLAPTRFAPVGLVRILSGPVDASLATAALVATLLASVAFTLGFRYRITGPVFAVLFLWSATYRNSWGHIAHGDNLTVLHVLVLAVTPAADTLSLDARRRPPRRPPSWSSRYGWPLRLMALTTVLTYTLAGWAKLRFGGMAWLSGEALHLHVAFDSLRKARLGTPPSGLTGLLLTHGWLLAPAGVLTIALEFFAPIILSIRRLRIPWIAGLWLLHVGIAVIMTIAFTYPLSLVAFVPLFRVERAGAWLRRRSRRRAGA